LLSGLYGVTGRMLVVHVEVFNATEATFIEVYTRNGTLISFDARGIHQTRMTYCKDFVGVILFPVLYTFLVIHGKLIY
jgi:hypothetical protein